MKSFTRGLLALLVIFMASSVSAQQLKSRQAQIDYLQTKSDRLVNYLEDFVALSYPEKYGADGDRAFSLYDWAAMAGEFSRGMQMLLVLDSQLCDTDRTKARQVIKRSSDHYATQLGIIIAKVNIKLEQTKLPALAATAMQMKNDLRELKGFFETVQ